MTNYPDGCVTYRSITLHYWCNNEGCGHRSEWEVDGAEELGAVYPLRARDAECPVCGKEGRCD
jgi:hypothetical protein